MQAEVDVRCKLSTGQPDWRGPVVSPGMSNSISAGGPSQKLSEVPVWGENDVENVRWRPASRVVTSSFSTPRASAAHRVSISSPPNTNRNCS